MHPLHLMLSVVQIFLAMPQGGGIFLTVITLLYFLKVLAQVTTMIDRQW